MSNERLAAFGLRQLRDGSLVDPGRERDRYAREGGASERSESDLRTPTEQDRGRLGYSTYLRRLAGVTQVVSPELDSAQMHSRSSHSHKVAMISREIAEYIVRRSVDGGDDAWLRVIKDAGGLDISACEAAGLAHDIGHPPFGHAGEEAIDAALRRRDGNDTEQDRTGSPERLGLGSAQSDDLASGEPREPSLSDTDGFEGNAQTFRTVTRLDRLKGRAPFGLNLTNVTLGAILKYPFIRQEPYDHPDNGKFGAYLSDEEMLRTVRKRIMGVEPDDDSGEQSLEASVMDLADDMAYAIHDLEDFLAAHLIDLAQVDAAIGTALFDAGIDEPINAAVDDPKSEAFAGARFESTSPSVGSESVFTLAARRHSKKYAPLYSDQLYAEALYDVRQALREFGDQDDENYAVNLRMKLATFVQRFFEEIDVRAVAAYEGGPRVSLSAKAWHQMQILKSITRHFLVARPRMGILQRAQTKAIELLLDGLADWICSAPKIHSLPHALLWTMGTAGAQLPPSPISRDSLTPAHWRAISDYVCTMSDSEALLRSQWLSGSEVPGSFRLALS